VAISSKLLCPLPPLPQILAPPLSCCVLCLCRPRRAACRAACSACSVMDEKGNSATSMGLRFGDLALASHGVMCEPLSTLRIQSIGFQKKCVNLTGATPQQLPAAARRPPAPRAATGPSQRALLPLRPPALHAVPQRSCSTPVPRATATASAPAPIKSQGTSRRALLGLSEPQLRQVALHLGQVHCTREVLFASVTLPACLCLTHL